MTDAILNEVAVNGEQVITTAAEPDALPVRRIYVASSWRNPDQPEVVDRLRARGFEVYDFRNPPGRSGFAWSEIDPGWQSWTAAEYIAALEDPLAVAGYASDFAAMQWADTFVLVLPCGRSAHLELGWAVGAGKRAVIITRDGEEPELMAKMVDYIAVGLDDALEYLSRPDAPATSDHVSERCRWCLPAGVEHLNQASRSVYKHQHIGDGRCTRPWTALCQTEHGSLCYVSDHDSQPDATTALDAHVRAGRHILSGDEDQPALTECRALEATP